LDRAMEGDVRKFSIEKSDTFEVQFTTEEGFTYGIDESKISVTFNHQLRTKAVSGGHPVMEMLSKALPYTVLLPEVSKKVIEATVLLAADPGTRKVTRVGIVSSTRVAEEEAPPGIARFITYLGRPWTRLTEGFGVQLTGEIGKESDWSDKCIHTIVKPGTQDPQPLLALVFDWQRTYISGRPTDKASLEDMLRTAEAAALEYFEELAEGSRFDENLIRDTASA